MNIVYFPNSDPNYSTEVLTEKFVCKVSFSQAQKLSVFEAVNVRNSSNTFQFVHFVPEEDLKKSFKEKGNNLKRFSFYADIEFIIQEPTLWEKFKYIIKSKLSSLSIFNSK